jgi:hypothetical protein
MGIGVHPPTPSQALCQTVTNFQNHLCLSAVNSCIIIAVLERPIYLLLLWFVTLLALFLWYAYKKKRQTALMFFDSAMAERLMPTLDAGRFFRKALLLLLAFVFGIVAARRSATYLTTVSNFPDSF